jgi:hypothetical protein
MEDGLSHNINNENFHYQEFLNNTDDCKKDWKNLIWLRINSLYEYD